MSVPGENRLEPAITVRPACRHPAIAEGRIRFHECLLPRRVRELYVELRDSAHVVSLGEVATVGIGNVTGDNDFFHVDTKTAAAYRLPSNVLRPSVRDGSELVGLRFTREEWQALHGAGHANLLLHI